MLLGTEMGGRFTSGIAMGGSSLDVCSRWRSLVASVRTAAPQLKLSYSPTAAGTYNDIESNEAQYLCFWDELDYIGINAYPDLNYYRQPTPTAQLGSGFKAYRRLFDPENYNGISTDDYVIGPGRPASLPLGTAPGLYGFNFGMPIAPTGFAAFDLGVAANYQTPYHTNKFSMKWYVDFIVDAINAKYQVPLQAKGKWPLKALLTEVGSPSSENSQGNWGLYATNADSAIFRAEQARGWDGYLRAFYGDPRIVGIHMWGLSPYTDARQAWSVANLDWKRGYDFYGKPETQEIVCQWFKRAYVVGSAAACYTGTTQPVPNTAPKKPR